MILPCLIKTIIIIASYVCLQVNILYYIIVLIFLKSLGAGPHCNKPTNRHWFRMNKNRITRRAEIKGQSEEGIGYRELKRKKETEILIWEIITVANLDIKWRSEKCKIQILRTTCECGVETGCMIFIVIVGLILLVRM